MLSWVVVVARHLISWDTQVVQGTNRELPPLPSVTKGISKPNEEARRQQFYQSRTIKMGGLRS